MNIDAQELMDILGVKPGEDVSIVFPWVAVGQAPSVSGRLIGCHGVWITIEQYGPEVIRLDENGDITTEPLQSTFTLTTVQQARKGPALQRPEPRQCERCQQGFMPTNSIDPICPKCRSVVPVKGPVILPSGNA